MVEQNASPILQPIGSRPETMDFTECLDALLSGQKVRRLEWPDDGTYLIIADEKIMIFKIEDDMLHPLIISRTDILGTDWVIIHKEN